MLTNSVLLIHGLFCRPWLMAYFTHGLRQRGWPTQTFGYASRQLNFAENVQLLQQFLQRAPSQSYHIVAHSLGGLLTLAALNNQPNIKIKRIILLGSPIKGSVCGQYIASYRLGKKLLGQNADFWHNLPNISLPQVEVGVIAGNRVPWLSTGNLIKIAAPHDGIVRVDETKIAGLTDFLVLPVSHTSMLFSKNVILATHHFLTYGKFSC